MSQGCNILGRDQRPGKSHVIATVLIACALPWVAVAAEIYKSVDADGNVVYSDRAGADGMIESERIELPPANRMTSPPRSAAATGNPLFLDDTQTPEQTPSYRVSIRTPEPDETIRSNPGTVPVRFSVEPDLTGNHRVEVLLDGAPRPESVQGNSVELREVDRGSHDLKLRIVDADGRLLTETTAVRFHLLRASVNSRPRAN